MYFVFAKIQIYSYNLATLLVYFLPFAVLSKLRKIHACCSFNFVTSTPIDYRHKLRAIKVTSCTNILYIEKCMLLVKFEQSMNSGYAGYVYIEPGNQIAVCTKLKYMCVHQWTSKYKMCVTSGTIQEE